MKIFVCVKHVPDTEAKLEPSSGCQINEDEIKWILSPYDEFAVEEAIQLKEKQSGAEVIVVSLGKQKAVESIRKSLAMGADRALHVVTDECLDHHVIASALASAIKNDGDPSVIFMGKQAIDDDSFQIHIRVAHQLEASVATNVSSFTFENNEVEVTRDVEEGAKEKLVMKIPAVVAVTKGINTPRYPSLPNIMKAKRKPVKNLGIADLGITDTTNHEEIIELALPQEKAGGKIIDGEYEVAVPQLASLLKNEAKVL